MHRLTALVAVLGGVCSCAVFTGCASEQRETVPAPGVTLQPMQSAKACAVVAQDMETSGDVTNAIRYYQMARDADPVAYQWVAHRLGVLYARSGDLVAADIEFRRAWRLNPNDPSVVADWAAVFEES